MKTNYAFLEKNDYGISFVQENIEMIIYSLICLAAPFTIGHPQFLVGVVVNAALVLSALNLRGWKLLPVIILPSIGVLSRGIIFGPFSIYLVYMVPFIWAGNAILVYAIKQFNLQKKLSSAASIGIGAALKTLFLFGSAFALVQLGVLPVVFLTAMGLMQLYTALAGGMLALGIQSAKKLF
ncbi:MAG: hypothetical protein KAT62_07095 [Desulfuromonadales bacterium]|nr:hypothetical protein [Desulfuromonadales bacterium]